MLTPRSGILTPPLKIVGGWERTLGYKPDKVMRTITMVIRAGIRNFAA